MTKVFFLCRLALLICPLVPLVLAPGFSAAGTLSLDQALAEALEKSRSLGQLDLERESRLHEIEERKSLFYPSVELSGGYSWQRASLAPGTLEGDSTRLGLNLRHALYTGGALESGYRVSRLGLEMVETSRWGAEQDIITTVTLSYIEVLRAAKAVSVLERLVRNRERHLRDVTARVEVGTLPRLEQLRAEVELAESRNRLLGAENALGGARGVLNRLIERELDAEWEAVEMVPDRLPAVPPRPDDFRAPVADRPEAGLARLGVEMAGEGVRAARASLYPTVALRAGREYRQDDAFRSSWRATDQVGVFFEYDIWNRGRTRQAVERSRRDLERASLAVEDRENALALELRNAWLRLDSARSRITALEKAVTQAEEVLRMQRIRFEEGLATPTEVMDADLAAAQAAISRDNATYDYLAAGAEWQRALGRAEIPFSREGR